MRRFKLARRVAILVSCLAVVVVAHFYSLATGARPNATSHHGAGGGRGKLGDGCFHVLLDLGSNIGMHVRFLLEPHLYPNARVARPFFEEHFGPEDRRSNLDFCVFSFEPNPAQWPRHDKMKRAYDLEGWRYHPIRGGVSDRDGNLTFYHTGDETGFTMLRSNCRKRCDPEHVPIYNLSDWIINEIRGRKLPQLHNPDPKDPRVVMKMDIEMMEYVVFPHLLETGVLCRDVHAMMGEFHLRQHWFYFPITFPDHNLTIQKWEDARTLRDEWIESVRRDPECGTQISLREDESHRRDGMLFPHEARNETLAPGATG